MGDAPDDGGAGGRIHRLYENEKLADSLSDRPGGEWFAADLQEARALAEHDPRFAALAAGLAAESLGARLEAINTFFDGIPAVELAALTLPPHLSQLRAIYLSSHS